MNKFEQLNDYLTEQKFDTGLSIKWDFEKNRFISRLQYLRDICKGKNIIHLGCLDHNMETITRKTADKTWLHQHLTDVSAHCLGIDIKRQLIDEMRTTGIDNIICSDLSTDDIRNEITSFKWDYLVCGEIIEHIDNPVAFLSSIRNKYESYIQQIIVTVPNSLYFGHIKNAFKTVESINTDHRYSFTPYNLSKILVNSGYRPNKIDLLMNFDPKTRGPIHRLIFKRFPLLRSGIIIEADF